jgi:DNA processing protein
VVSASLDDRKVAAATLAALPQITPARLRRLFGRHRGPEAALDAVRAGHGAGAIGGARGAAEDLATHWSRAVDPGSTRARLESRQTHVWLDGDADCPIREPIPGRPAVLFAEGDDVEVFGSPRVAIVGTRSATPNGESDARELGAALAGAGVTVVSGLALGIDGAAHEGAVGATEGRGGGGAVGVVAHGLDITYPRRHAALYGRVRERGVVVSEHWYGVRPHPAQFPVRNRIIAALCDVCVVVEATVKGGASITARYAAEYGREVFALPGARRNAAAAGCNALIADGAQVLLDPSDILIALSQGCAGSFWSTVPTVPDDPDDAAVLTALGGEPASTDHVVNRSGLGAARVAAALRRLEQQGAIIRRRGRWWPA